MSRILVTGGNGRLGQAVLAALGDRGVAGVRRRGIDGSIVIDGDGGVDVAALDGVAAIINCAGRVTGSPEAVEQANVAYPVALARTARSAGVGRFVQVSSFAVFGRVEHIGPQTPLAPANDYGRSKVAAEQALRALDTPTFRTLPLRLPFMFSAEHPALLGRLVATMRRLRVLPVSTAAPSVRSMITYAGAADALVALATTPELPDGALAAADPTPLDLRTVAAAIRDRLDTRIAILPVPEFLVSLAAKAVPGVVDRLFRSSVLDPAANTLGDAIRHPVDAELRRHVDRLAADGTS